MSTLVLVTTMVSVPAGVSADSGVAQSNTNPDPDPTPAEVDCSAAEGDLVPLCQAYNYISTGHVDTVTASQLAAKAAEYVGDAGLEARTDGMPPPCHPPTPEFAQVCTQIDAVEDTAGAVWAAIAGMVSLLDSQSFLWTIERHELYKASSENIQTRVGIDLALMDGDDPCEEVSSTCRPVIIDVYPGSPAETGGLMEGDVLVELNGPLRSNLACSHIPELDSFDENESVAVKVMRGTETVTASLQAAELDVLAARGRVVHGNVGYLRIDRFSLSAGADTETELDLLTAAGIGGLVLDLRDNPGGDLTATVDTTGLFLPDPSVVIHITNRSGDQTFEATGKAAAPDPDLLPMVVAVDKWSASGAEVLAGALKDHGRATVVGRKTYGKNTGQQIYQLEHGDGSMVGVLRLTTLRWTTPIERSAKGGFVPDVQMMLPRCLHPAEVARRAVAPVRPAVSGVAITSLPVYGTAYTAGQTVTVTATFVSPVKVDTTDGTPTLGLGIGGVEREATYTSGSETTELVFEYTIPAGDPDADGIHIAADALVLNGGAIRHPSGLDALLAHDGVAPDRQHSVSAELPTRIALSIEPSTVREDAGRTTVTVTAAFAPGSGTYPDDVVVSVSAAENPQKYQSTSVEVILRAGQAHGTADLFLTPVDDDIFENDRRVEVSGTAPGLAVSPATFTITDDEQPPPPPTRRPPPSQGVGVGGDSFPPPEPRPVVEPVVVFSDIGESVHRNNIETIASAGITQGCNPPDNDRYCPDQTITRAQIATLLTRALKLPEAERDYFSDDNEPPTKRTSTGSPKQE